MNIMSLVMQYFGPVILNKIAGSVGINSTLAQKAIAAAAPAILGGIFGRVSQPGGAKILGDAIGKQDAGLLGKLGEIIGTNKQASVVDQGNDGLASILGNSALGSLAGALSKHAGISVGQSNTLLGLVTPAVLGTLGREQKSSGLDAAGLANMLSGQQKKISDAIPGDFAKLLSGTGLLDGVMGKATHAASNGTSSSASMAKTTTASTSSTSSASTAGAAAGVRSGHSASPHAHPAFNWTPWLAAIAAAGALWWSLFGNKLTQPHPAQVTIPVTVPPSTTLATTTPLPAVVANTEVGKQIVGILDDMKGSIANVRDAATAQTALPRIQDVAGRLQKAGEQAQQLNPDARKALATFVNSQQGLIKTAVSNVLGLQGVAAILRPVLEQMLGRIEGLAKG